jgi:hypothetical protein
MNEAGRTLILALGSRPCDPVEFNNRSLTIRPTQPEELDNDDLLNQARGVVVTELPGKLRVTTEFFSRAFHRACEFGLLTLSHSPTQKDRDYFIAMRDSACQGVGLLDTGRLVSFAQADDTWHRIAEKFARHAPGPGVGKVKIETLDRGLTFDFSSQCLQASVLGLRQDSGRAAGRREDGERDVPRFCQFAGAGSRTSAHALLRQNWGRGGNP